MRHMLLLPATTLALWILNVGYVAIAARWPHLTFEPGQRLLAIITIVVSIAWLLRREGIEYRIGYRHGRNDRDR
jgi:4-amino-4-deoxy-L-arabinose transferase-like glycosyltransferase